MDLQILVSTVDHDLNYFPLGGIEGTRGGSRKNSKSLAALRSKERRRGPTGTWLNPVETHQPKYANYDLICFSMN